MNIELTDDEIKMLLTFINTSTIRGEIAEQVADLKKKLVSVKENGISEPTLL